MIVLSTFVPSVIVIDCVCAETVIEALPWTGIDIGLAVGDKVFATSNEEELAGEFTTNQHGWSTVTTIEYDLVGTR